MPTTATRIAAQKQEYLIAANICLIKKRGLIKKNGVWPTLGGLEKVRPSKK